MSRANDRFDDLVGIPAGHAVGKPVAWLFPAVPHETLCDLYRVLVGDLDGRHFTVVVEPERAGRARRSVSTETWRIHAQPVEGDGSSGVVLAAVNVSDDPF